MVYNLMKSDGKHEERVSCVRKRIRGTINEGGAEEKFAGASSNLG